MILDAEDRELVKSIKRHKCSPCIKEIRSKYIGLMLKIYTRYSKALKIFNFTSADFNDDIDYIIFNAARYFNLRKRKIKFSTWLGEQTKFYCLNKLNKSNRYKSIASIPEVVTKIMDDNTPHDDKLDNKETYDYVLHILDQIQDKRVKEIFQLRYFNGENKKMTYKEIGNRLNYRGQTIINLHNKTIKLLKEKLNGKAFQDKI